MTMVMRDRENFFKGKLEGEENEKIATAIRLNNLGASVDFIAKSVDRSIDVVKEWLDESIVRVS